MTVVKQVSLHGRRVFVTKDDQCVARGGFVSGGDDTPSIHIPGSLATVAFFDDFLGQALDTGAAWGRRQGTDTGAASSIAIVSGHPNGVLRLKVNNNAGVASGGAGAATVTSIVMGRNFKADQGRMRMTARVRGGEGSLDDTGANPNSVIMFCGWSSDTGGTGMPMFVDTGPNSTAGVSGKLAAASADVFGMLFDAIEDTGNGWGTDRWHGVSTNASTVTTLAPPPEGADGLKNSVWSVVEMELDRSAGDTGGTARFWLDGKSIGEIKAPVASTAKLTPTIALSTHRTDTGTIAVDVDFVAVSARRDTGF